VIERWLGLPRLTPEETGRLTGAVARVPTRRVGATTSQAPRLRPKQAPVALRLFLLETVAQCELKQLPTPWVEGLARAIESPPTRRRGVQNGRLAPDAFVGRPPDAVGGR